MNVRESKGDRIVLVVEDKLQSIKRALTELATYLQDIDPGHPGVMGMAARIDREKGFVFAFLRPNPEGTGVLRATDLHADDAGNH